MNQIIRILGIDPGLRITGFGIIDINGHKKAYVASGCIKTPEGGLPVRLKSIVEGVLSIIQQHAPMVAVIEEVFVNVNPQSTLRLGQARGAAICALVMSDLPVSEYTALQVKQAVVGNGHAKKEQVQHMVQQLLGLSGKPQADAADALACALTHAQYDGLNSHMAVTGLRMKRGRLV
jgi:crossover junction endodeoxyribonuclease RuvC